MGSSSGDVSDQSKLGAVSNGSGSYAGTDSLTANMENLSVSSGPGAADKSVFSNLRSSGVSPPDSSNLARTNSTSLRTNLNPNAQEFVPKAYKPVSLTVSGNASVYGEKEIAGSILNRTNSFNSNASDDEYRRLCRAQLPDDLMPDFELGDFIETTPYEESASQDASGGSSNVSAWSVGSLGNAVQRENLNHDDRFNPSAAKTPSYSPPGVTGARYASAPGPVSSASPGYVRPYMPELRSPVQQLNTRERQTAWIDSNDSGLTGNDWGATDLAYPEDVGEASDPVSILATEFPGFSSQSLAEIYYANGGDLTLTIDMLSELELQNEGATVKQFQSSSSPAPPSSRDFPALSAMMTLEAANAGSRPERAPLVAESRSVPDFAAAVRKQAAQQAAQLQFERNGGVDLSAGGVRGLTQGPGVGAFSRDARVAHSGRMEPFHLHVADAHQPPPAWLETGDSVANLYSDMREEARDHARIRNAYFDQARQAYLVGNKALAKELSAKGQWHNEQMKAAHSKAGEAIFWQRNANAYVNSNSAPGQSRLLDLHGLHVGEAIPLLKRELTQLKHNVRSTRQREQVYVCVGTGHHTKGSRTPSRLPAAVQRYLSEEEHLLFEETQPGMLRIIIR